MTIQVTSPGKIILTGEHAVVFGKPALAMATRRYLTAQVNLTYDSSITLNGFSRSFEQVAPIHRSVFNRYNQAKEQGINLAQVMLMGDELPWVVIYDFLQRYRIQQGVEMTLRSDIPRGAGMGSSAALILTLLGALHRAFNLDISDENFLNKALHLEHLQHGQSSGFDLATCYYGGYQARVLPVPSFMPPRHLWLLHSGEPQNSTGEVVARVKANFAKDHPIWSAFAEVSGRFFQDSGHWPEAMAANHRLLVKLGVVPPRVAELISKIEAAGGRAKTSGAGALMGDGAGMLLVWFPEDLPQWLQKQGLDYQAWCFEGEFKGVKDAMAV